MDNYSENILLSSSKGKAESEYWTRKLQGEAVLTGFSEDSKYIEADYNSSSGLKFEISGCIHKKLQHFSNHSLYAEYMVLLSGIYYLIYRYTGIKNIILGMPGLIQKEQGEFIKTILPLRTVIEEEDYYYELLEKSKDVVLEADKNQNISLGILAELLELEKVHNKFCFKTIVLLENIHRIECLEKIIGDITFLFSDKAGKLFLNILYDGQKFSERLIKQIYQQYIYCLEQFINNPKIKLSETEILSDKEKNQILTEFNHTEYHYESDKTIIDLFFEQVNKNPNDTALVMKEQKITYEKLDKMSNQVANLLFKKGIRQGDIVAILTERSVDMIIGIIGILKTGAAYLPIDSKYPNERINYILSDSKVSIILSSLAANKSDLKNSQILKWVDLKNGYIKESEQLTFNCNKNKDLTAYIIYTSGSTGKPKGVMVGHKGVVNLKEYFENILKINNSDRILQFASCSFDASVWEIFMALLTGASLYLVEEDIINNYDIFTKYVNTCKITTITLPPVYLNHLNPDSFMFLKRVITAGSATTKQLVSKWNKNIAYMNAYGPTEATVCTSVYETDENINDYNSVPIGKPMINSYSYILDEKKRIVPIGVAGELCVSGIMLAKGYLNKPDLTESKFILNPYKKKSIMYCTGDLVRWLDDGNIEYIGRIDNQVKVRGYRIELDEIENILLSHSDIKEAVVLLISNHENDKSLSVYYVGTRDINQCELKAYLLKYLPDYMIPAFFIQLDNMPLTISGKLDRKKLRMIPLDQIRPESKEKPKNDMEKILCHIWEEVLDISPIGIKEDFFLLGGDSIKAIQVLSHLGKLKLKLSLKELFLLKTIEQIAEVIKVEETDYEEQKEIIGPIQYTPIQKWFIEENFVKDYQWNQSVILYGKNGLDENITRAVFCKILKHHDGLRIVRKFDKSLYNNEINESDIDILKVYKIAGENYKEQILIIANETQESFKLDKGPLVNAVLFQTEMGEYLLICAHHMVIDGVSWRILFEDFTSGYLQAKNHELIDFQNKTTSYKTWSEKINIYATSNELKEELEYWKKTEEIFTQSLLSDHIVENSLVKDCSSLEISLSKNDTKDLLTKVNKKYNTEINDILLTGLGLALKEWKNMNLVRINLEGHGREELLSGINLSRTVGWFTSQYPVILELSHSENLSYQIKNVKETIRKIPKKGLGYGILRYLSSKRDIDYKDAEIGFNYLGQFGNEIDNTVIELSDIQSEHVVHPASRSLFKLNVNAVISEDKLTFSITYNRYEYDNSSIMMLEKLLKKYLLEIISLCKQDTQIERTPSDYGLLDMSTESFDSLYRKWGDKIDKIYYLSPMQEGMLYYAMLNKNRDTYFQQISFQVHGNISIQILTKCFDYILSRHDTLRTNFVYKNLQRPIQIVMLNQKAEINYEDISNIESQIKKDYIANYMEKDREKGFNLEKGSLFRMTLLKINENEYELIWNFHHIVMDGWCLGILTKEFFQLYDFYLNKTELRLLKAPVYKNFIDWIKHQDKGKAEIYWQEYLNGYEVKACLPQRKEMDKKYLRKEKTIILKEKCTTELTETAMKLGVTLNTMLQVVWGILLQKYNGTDDVVFGAVTSGRNPEIENIGNMVGLFINTLPIRVESKCNSIFSELVVRLQEKSLESDRYSYYPLADIQEKHELKGELIDHIMVFENLPLEKLAFSEKNKDRFGFDIEYDFSFQQTNYDLSITISPDKVMGIKFVYNSYVYPENFIESIIEHFNIIIHCIIDNPDVKISDISLLDDKKKEVILYDFNSTDVVYNYKESITHLFEKQVLINPGFFAVKSGQYELTYDDLNKKSNSLARYLIKKGIDSNKPIGIMLYPGVEMVIGILGCLKTGGAYLPMDPQSTPQRIEEIIEDSKIDYMLVQKENFEDAKKYKVELIDLCQVQIYLESSDNLYVHRDSNSLAYVIYTSGTTGKPKGIMLEDKGIVNYCNWFCSQFEIDSKDSTVLISSFAFDLGYTALYPSLLCGAKLHLIRKEIYSNTVELLNYIQREKITYLKSTPSYFHLFVNNSYFRAYQFSLSLRLILLGGEKINKKDIIYFHNKYKKICVVNHYGPTEATIGCITQEIKFDLLEQDVETTVIGKPIANMKAYILDSFLNLVPVGVNGEICIAGPGLARGYLNKDELNCEKFILNCNKKEAEIIYKTGDIGRYLEDGSIEYIGRKDSQVKIRGYRVELKEIEEKLLKLDVINQAVVFVKMINEQILCACLILNKISTEKEIHSMLLKEMPEYMIPDKFMFLDKMPLTSNNKVNMKLLENKINETGELLKRAVLPKNSVEELMLHIFMDILKREDIGVEHSFFEIGGHSIKLIELISKIYEVFDVELFPQQVIEAQTARKLSECLKKNDYKDSQPLQLLNKDQKNKIFFFPPVGGYGLVYKQLADSITNYACYSFNYIKGGNGQLLEYVKYMREIQETGPYVVAGWSAGGNLAYEIVKILEAEEEEVSDLILFDTYRITESSNISKAEIEEMVSKNLSLAQEDPIYKEYLNRNDFIRQQVGEKMGDYFDYLRNNMRNTGKINSNIHMLLSTDEVKLGDGRFLWQDVLNKKFDLYYGAGTHSYMLYGNFLNTNTHIISSLLKKIFTE